MSPAKTFDVETPVGVARVHVHPATEPRAALALGHGAGGGVAAKDLVAVSEVAIAEGFSVALVEQPYLVAGRRSPAPARQLDVAWTAVIDWWREIQPGSKPLVAGGRSAGARVACRTAKEVGAVAVLCLAFPVHAPGRATGTTRLDELDGVAVPVLVVQGERDPFGMPPPAGQRTVVQVSGDHSLKTDLEGVVSAVRAWLPGVVTRADSSPVT